MKRILVMMLVALLTASATNAQTSGNKRNKCTTCGKLITACQYHGNHPWATRIDTIWYEEPLFTEQVVNGYIIWKVFESDFNGSEPKIVTIGNFLKDHHECNITIKSYVDSKTGLPSDNMRQAKTQLNKVVESLVHAGVERNRITSEIFGGALDGNGVFIHATGLKDVNEMIMLKKFRIIKNRYRVR